MPILAKRPAHQDIGKDQFLQALGQKDHKSNQQAYENAPAGSFGVEQIGPAFRSSVRHRFSYPLKCRSSEWGHVPSGIPWLK
jgi:hypothetical protein